MNAKIESLNAKLAETMGNASAIEMELQAEWNKVFDASTAIREAISRLDMSTEYQTNEYGEICQWVDFDLGEFEAVREYLREYLRDLYCVDLDAHNDILTMSLGSDCLIIQDDAHRARDSGVWQGHKLIIPQSDFETEDGEIDETKRNELIESYMEASGYFPGVFRVDQHGNVFPVNTQEAANERDSD